MFTIVNNKIYLVENDKMFPVNIAIEKGIEKVGEGKALTKGYQIYTLNEILVKFNIEKDKPYFYDKEKVEAKKGQPKPQGNNDNK